MNKNDRHIGLIVTRLKKLHRKDGSWADNNFINALVSYSLSEMKAPDKMTRKSCRFIISRKKQGWTWNYHSKTAGGKYPDDLDDTFCSLIAIQKIKPRIIDGTALAHIAELLMNAGQKESGPYFTWIGKVWNDIDPVVNANISCFASIMGIEMPGLTRYIDQCIGTKYLTSKYYSNPFLAYYFIARNYRGSKREILIGNIRRELKNNGGINAVSLANAALSACALIRLDVPP